MAEQKKPESKGPEGDIPEDANLADHRSGVLYDEDTGLEFLFHKVPHEGSVIEVAKGILWARMPLPWSLDHINIYLFDEGDSWTVVDTGSNGNSGRTAWEALERDVLGDKPLKRVIATHMHPDHLGLAGWLVERHGADFYTTQAEYLLANTLWMSASAEFPQSELDFLFQAGVDRQYGDMIKSAGFGNYKKGVHRLPTSFHRLEDGSEFTLGGRRWRTVIGRGHSPEHACLMCLDEPLFVAGDQVLPQITSNVSVYAREPLANPLAHWIASLERLKQVNGDPVVLPAHGPVFRGLGARLQALIDSHLRKLVSLHALIADEECTPVEMFPALFRRKITGFDFFMALGEAVAHIHLLESVGLATRRFDGEVNRFKAEGDIASADITARVMALEGVPLRSLKDFE